MVDSGAPSIGPNAPGCHRNQGADSPSWEQVFAQQGVEAANLRDINRLAGQANNSALHYHFGSREALVHAVVQRHRPAISACRAELVRAMAESPAVPSPRQLIHIIAPLASDLATESGRCYVRMVCHMRHRHSARQGQVLDGSLTPDQEWILDHLDRLLTELLGSKATYEAFQAGESDVAFLNSPEVIADAKDNGDDGWFLGIDLGLQYLLNLRDGFIGNDVRLREAVWRAINPDLLNQQVFGGAREMHNSPIMPDSMWAKGEPATVGYDPQRAKQLVAEAKAAGVDTAIEFLADNSPATSDVAVAIQGMLQAAGFEVTITTVPLNEKIAQVFQGRFEITNWAAGVEPAEEATRLYGVLHSTAVNNRGGYKSDEMDAALDAAMRAGVDQKADAVMKINDIYVRDFVSPNVAKTLNGVVWKEKVKGVVPAPTSIFLFHNAYLED